MEMRQGLARRLGCPEMKMPEVLHDSLFQVLLPNPRRRSCQAADAREVPSPSPRTGSLDRGSWSCDKDTKVA